MPLILLILVFLTRGPLERSALEQHAAPTIRPLRILVQQRQVRVRAQLERDWLLTQAQFLGQRLQRQPRQSSRDCRRSTHPQQEERRRRQAIRSSEFVRGCIDVGLVGQVPEAGSAVLQVCLFLISLVPERIALFRGDSSLISRFLLQF
jgi:hypothetical protein